MTKTWPRIQGLTVLEERPTANSLGCSTIRLTPNLSVSFKLNPPQTCPASVNENMNLPAAKTKPCLWLLLTSLFLSREEGPQSGQQQIPSPLRTRVWWLLTPQVTTLVMAPVVSYSGGSCGSSCFYRLLSTTVCRSSRCPMTASLN